ncbi:MAG: hypothetical protein HQL40_06885 [Alphaproteobacteria bacterium]|nr:hypothetical protein [Alphaproteobacteria bacterium]
MASTMRIVVDTVAGDGKWRSRMPEAVRAHMRPKSLATPEGREKRLMNVAEAIFPGLQSIEEAAYPQDQRLLAGKDFETAIQQSHSIERGMAMFDVAWQTGLVRIFGGATGKALGFGVTDETINACGLTIGEGRLFFVRIAARQILANNAKAAERLLPFVVDREALPRLRLLTGIDPLAIEELRLGLGERLRELVATKEEDFLNVLAKLKGFQARGLRAVMKDRFPEILGWDARMVEAVVETFQCPEQFRDLGDAFAEAENHDAIRAIGHWERRDITERVNVERVRQGKERLKGRRHETDIGAARPLIGEHFRTLMRRDAGTIEFVGHRIAEWRRLDDEAERERLGEEIQALVGRFADFCTLEVLHGLHLVGRDDDDTLSLGEALGLLEGIWDNPSLGQGFFAGPFRMSAGVRAVEDTATEYMEMKRRGAPRSRADLRRMLAGSEGLERTLQPFMRRARG